MQLTKTTLYKECEPFKLVNTEADISFRLDLANSMIEFMEKNNGMGLAANQIGMKKQLFVMKYNGKVWHCFNPRIVEFGSTLCELNEGCLSFPDQRAKLLRPESITVEYENALGNIVNEELSGMEARCFQHEFDHLHGITMFKRQTL